MLWMFVRPMRHLVTHGGAELLRLLVVVVLVILTSYLMVILAEHPGDNDARYHYFNNFILH